MNNYGHNNPRMRDAIIAYMQNDGITHSLDMATVAKQTFLETFERLIMQPRGLDYKVQFTGPTGTNAVEAAVKIARKVTGRTNIIAFTSGYHGLTAGALAMTANPHFRHPAFPRTRDVTFMPFDGFLGEEVDTVAYLRAFLESTNSGIDKPAAVILETVQAEGGINVARSGWLQALAELCREMEILLIIDDIQVGNGRTGDYFSFEAAGLSPDIVTLSKAIGGYGLPMSIVLLKPEIDQWKPAEHTGTFRGNNLAFVAGTEALRYWESADFGNDIKRKSEVIRDSLHAFQAEFPQLELQVRGRGMIYGLEIPDVAIANAVKPNLFKRGLIMEGCGEHDHVLKFLPPLIIEDDLLQQGLEIVGASLTSVLNA